MDPGVPSDQNEASHVPGPLVNQPVYVNQQSIARSPGSAASYQFQRGTGLYSGVVRPGQRNSRFPIIVTVLIVLATLVLLGFSIYLAAELGFITLPFIKGSNPTPAVITAIVPNLVGDEYATAQTEAEKAGFHLQLATGQTSTDGVVVKQAPAAGQFYPKGDTIEVTMQPKRVKVPQNFNGSCPILVVTSAIVQSLRA